jgi:hypothetical protein
MAIVNGLKISQLDLATDFQPTDLLAVSRGNKTYKLLGSRVIDKITATTRYEAIVPTGTSRNINMVHNLNSLNVNINVYEIATGQVVFPTVTVLNANTIRLTFRAIPTSDQYRVFITK